MAATATRAAADSASTPGDAREKLLEAAYELFSREGVQAVGIDAIIARAGVARQSLYRTFGSKQQLVLAFLQRRDEVWTTGWLQHEVESRTKDPAERLLAIFDVFHEWFQTPDYEGCSFINVMLEHTDPADPIRAASAAHLHDIRAIVAGYAGQAGISDTDEFARQWHILMKGSIISAGEGDHAAAKRAQSMGRLVLAEHARPWPSTSAG